MSTPHPVIELVTPSSPTELRATREIFQDYAAQLGVWPSSATEKARK